MNDKIIREEVTKVLSKEDIIFISKKASLLCIDIITQLATSEKYEVNNATEFQKMLQSSFVIAIIEMIENYAGGFTSSVNENNNPLEDNDAKEIIDNAINSILLTLNANKDNIKDLAFSHYLQCKD